MTVALLLSMGWCLPYKPTTQHYRAVSTAQTINQQWLMVGVAVVNNPSVHLDIN